MILCFVVEDLEAFNFWLAGCELRKQQARLNLLWREFKHFSCVVDVGNLVFLELYFYVPNVLPAFFFRWVIKKSLLKQNIKIKFLTLKKGLGVLIGSSRGI